MKSKKRHLAGARLYVIADKKILKGRPLFNIVGKIRDGGADIIQLRDKQSKKEVIIKEARALNKLCLNHKTILMINDYLDIAKITDADGVHLGQGDTSVKVARKILGKHKLIGISCHNLQQAAIAQEKRADYIGIGPIFPSLTKPGYRAIGPGALRRISKRIKIPFFAIGGINENNLRKVLSSGAKRVAVGSAVCKNKDVFLATKNFGKLLS